MSYAGKKFILVFVVVLITLMLVEVLARYMAPQNLVPRYVRPDAELGNITRENMNYLQLRYDMKTTYRVQTNSAGLRMNEEIDHSSGKEKILFLGDSVAFGWELNVEDTFFYLLREILEPGNNIQLLNAGQPGYSTGHVFKNLRRYNDIVNISAAIYFMNPNDITDNVDQNIDYKVFSYKRNQDGEIELTENLVFSPHKRFLLTKTPYAWINQNIHSLFLIKRSVKSFFQNPSPTIDVDSIKSWSEEQIREVYDVSLSHLANLAGFARDKNIKLLIVWIPAPAELFEKWNIAECTHGMDYAKFKKAVAANAEILSNSVIFFDAKDVFANALGDLEDNEIYHGGAGCNFHFNKKGNELFTFAMTDEIQNFLQSLNE